MRRESFGCYARSARGRPLYFAARAKTWIFVGRGREPVTSTETSSCESAVETWNTTQSTWDPSGSSLCPLLPLNISLSTLFSAFYLNTLQRIVPQNMLEWFLSVSSSRFCIVLEGENIGRPTTLTSVDPDERTGEKVTRNRFCSRTTSLGLSEFRSLLIKCSRMICIYKSRV